MNSADHDIKAIDKIIEKRLQKHLPHGCCTNSDYYGICYVVAKDYHEHMIAKSKAANAELQALAIEQTCKICDYSFQGAIPCKCHMRVSGDVFQAVLNKHAEQII